MTGSYDSRLVILSVLVAILASYTALDLSGRVSAAGRRARAGWLAAGSLAMGVGIWSMHFIGMLAFRLPVPIRYDMTLWLVSVGVAVGASLLALIVVGRPRMGARTLLVAGGIMGAAIAGMHYTGMAAMRIPAHIGYDPALVAGSVVIAIGASCAALWLAFRLRAGAPGQMAPRVASAVLMGLAIAGMHYTGMAAVRISEPRPGVEAHGSLLASDGLAGWVLGGTLGILGLAVIGAAVDRGVRRRKEELAAIKRSEDRFRSLVSGLPAIVYQAEPTPPYGTIYVSPGVASLGYALEEWLARPDSWVRVLHPDDRAWVLERTLAALASGQRTDMQYRVITRDGSVRWMHDQGGFVRNEAGEPLYWQGVMLDITDRTLAQAERADSRTQLRQIIDVVPHGLFVKDDQGRFILVNREFARLFAMEPEQLEGRMEAEILGDPERAEFFRQSDQEVIRTGEPYYHTDGPFISPDGQERVTETIKVPFRRAGTDRPAVLGLTRDVTAERARERQLRRAGPSAAARRSP
jgi:PAS domain S-box-containing protein